MSISFSKYKEENFIDPTQAKEGDVVDPLKKMIGSLGAEQGLEALRDELSQTIENDEEEVKRAREQLSDLEKNRPKKNEVMEAFSQLRKILKEKTDLASMRSALREFKGNPKAKEILLNMVSRLQAIERDLGNSNLNDKQRQELKEEEKKLNKDLSKFLKGDKAFLSASYQKILSAHEEEIAIRKDTIQSAPEGLEEKRKKIALLDSKISRIKRLQEERDPENFNIVSIQGLDKKKTQALIASINEAIKSEDLSEDERHLLISITEMLDFKVNNDSGNYDVHILLTNEELVFFEKTLNQPKVEQPKVEQPATSRFDKMTSAGKDFFTSTSKSVLKTLASVGFGAAPPSKSGSQPKSPDSRSKSSSLPKSPVSTEDIGRSVKDFKGKLEKALIFQFTSQRNRKKNTSSGTPNPTRSSPPKKNKPG